jgi:hypothetical protein
MSRLIKQLDNYIISLVLLVTVLLPLQAFGAAVIIQPYPYATPNYYPYVPPPYYFHRYFLYNPNGPEYYYYGPTTIYPYNYHSYNNYYNPYAPNSNY